MSEPSRMSKGDVQALAALVDLDLPPDGVPALRTSLTEYLDRVATLRSLDPGDREPPVITYEDVDRDEPEG